MGIVMDPTLLATIKTLKFAIREARKRARFEEGGRIALACYRAKLAEIWTVRRPRTTGEL
jgi:hypothetical protein